jgi:Transposase DDE domain group 1
MEEGTNSRFVVTNKLDEPDELYAHYTERGETENRIKDLKVALKADRLSCHRFWANQFRLLVHAAAYWLMDTLRKKLVDVGIERMQLDALRLKLVKIGGRGQRPSYEVPHTSGLSASGTILVARSLGSFRSRS